MRYRVDDLTGPPLDLAVARTEGPSAAIVKNICYVADVNSHGKEFEHEFYPSTNWADGGPIIERERMDIDLWHGGTCWAAFQNLPSGSVGEMSEGPTPLIAAMRCYVKSRGGDYVDLDVPDKP